MEKKLLHNADETAEKACHITYTHFSGLRHLWDAFEFNSGISRSLADSADLAVSCECQPFGFTLVDNVNVFGEREP